MSRKALSILLVEDSADDALLIQHQLERGGYTPRMQRVDGEHAPRAALTGPLVRRFPPLAIFFAIVSTDSPATRLSPRKRTGPPAGAPAGPHRIH